MNTERCSPPNWDDRYECEAAGPLAAARDTMPAIPHDGKVAYLDAIAATSSSSAPIPPFEEARQLCQEPESSVPATQQVSTDALRDSGALARIVGALRLSSLRFALLSEYMSSIYPRDPSFGNHREELHVLARTLGIDAAQISVLEEWVRCTSLVPTAESTGRSRPKDPDVLAQWLTEAGIPVDAVVAASGVRMGGGTSLGASSNGADEPGNNIFSGSNGDRRSSAPACSTAEHQVMLEIRNGLSPRVLNRVIEHIEGNLEQKLRLVELAAVAGVSVSHFKTLFRRSKQISVHRYVMERRVDRARTLLEQGTPIPVVALEAGFTDASHMARWMRRLLGVTPRQVLKRCR